MNVIGIDFGGSDNKIGYFEQSSLQIIANEFGKYTNPCYICFQNDGQHYYRQQAKSMAVSRPKDTIFDIKRLLGKKYSDISNQISNWPFTIKQGKENSIIISTDACGDHDLIEITSLILKDLLNLTKILGKNTDKVVISIPDYYQSSEIQAMGLAAQKAGIQNYRLLNDTILASIWHSFWLFGTGIPKSKNRILFLDFGSLSLQISRLIIEFNEESKCHVNSTILCQDLTIGGSYLDEIIFSLAKSQLPNPTNLTERNIRKIKSLCEEAKIQLSSQDPSMITLEKEDGTFTATIFRDNFIEAIRNPIMNSSTFQKLQPKLTNTSPDFEVVMVGGCAYSPFIRSLIGQRLKMNISESQNANEYVVKGACLAAARMFLKDELEQWKIASQSQNLQHRYQTFNFLLNLEINKLSNNDHPPKPSPRPNPNSHPDANPHSNPSPRPNPNSHPDASSTPYTESPSVPKKQRCCCCLLL